MRILLLITLFLTAIVSANEHKDKDFWQDIEALKKESELKEEQNYYESLLRHEAFEKERFAYDVFTFDDNKNSFTFQNIQTWVIFVIVMLLVISGVYLAYLQFKLDEKKALAQLEIQKLLARNSATEPQLGTSADNGENSFEVSTSGIKITSSVIGLVVLAMSFAFFYMYVLHVYDLKVTAY
ncbi:hypothetical protein KUL150_06710 [Alteromonas sp. KUL150]|nr:hypothetical protein KUL150_06710 [Alteromonas sp. KUL150]